MGMEWGWQWWPYRRCFRSDGTNNPTRKVQWVEAVVPATCPVVIPQTLRTRFCGKQNQFKCLSKVVKAGITCDKCGTTIPRGSKFCPNCADEVNPRPECGGDNDKNAAKCRSCGSALPIQCPKCAAPQRHQDSKSRHPCGTKMIPTQAKWN